MQGIQLLHISTAIVHQRPRIIVGDVLTALWWIGASGRRHYIYQEKNVQMHLLDGRVLRM